MATNKKKRIKKRAGPVPPVLGKGGPMKDRTKYQRKRKHNDRNTDDL